MRSATRLTLPLLAMTVTSAVVAAAGSASPRSFPGPAGKIAITLGSSGTAEPGVRVMNPDGSALSIIPAAGGHAPVWSADGMWLAYTTFPEPWVIRVVRADGTGDREVLSATAGAPVTAPGFAWSPTGAEIAYRCATGLCAARVSDGTTRRILEVSSRFFLASPAWSPDGSKIAFACSGGVGLCLVNADGTNAVGYSPQPGLFLRFPDWSPDGSQLLVSGGTKVYTLDLDDGEVRLLVDMGAQLNARAHWSPDGQRILISQGSATHAMRLDGSPPVKIADVYASDWGTSPAITVSDARFEPKWVLSRQFGTIVLRGTASHTSSLTVTLRSEAGSYSLVPAAVAAGDYTVSVRLPSDLLPGMYEAVVGGSSGSVRLLDTARSALLPRPTAGLVARSWIATRTGGLPRDRVPRGTKRLVAHFAFSLRPAKGQRLTAIWRSPSGTVRRSVRAGAVVRSSVLDGEALASGRWRCSIEAGGTVLAIASIRVG